MFIVIDANLQNWIQYLEQKDIPKKMSEADTAVANTGEGEDTTGGNSSQQQHTGSA